MKTADFEAFGKGLQNFMLGESSNSVLLPFISERKLLTVQI